KIILAEELESCRQHADHRKAVSVERYRLASDRRIAAEFLPPKRVAEQRGRRRGSLVILFDEHPSELRSHAQQAKEIPAYRPASEARRLIHARQVEQRAAKTRHLRERLRPLAPIQVIRIGHTHPALP